MGVKKAINNLENIPIEDDDIAVDKREFLDDNGVDIYSKKSGEKTVEERIRTSRSLKIKNNRWNQIDYTEDFTNEKIPLTHTVINIIQVMRIWSLSRHSMI